MRGCRGSVLRHEGIIKGIVVIHFCSLKISVLVEVEICDYFGNSVCVLMLVICSSSSFSSTVLSMHMHTGDLTHVPGNGEKLSY